MAVTEYTAEGWEKGKGFAHCLTPGGLAVPGWIILTQKDRDKGKQAYTDLFEWADITANTCFDWMIDRAYLMYAARSLVRQFLETFKEFPPRMKPASFTADQVLAKMDFTTERASCRKR